MIRFVSIKSMLGFVAFAMACSMPAFAQQPAQQGRGGQGGQAQGAQAPGARAGGGGAGQARPGVVLAPLFLKVEWVRPPSQTAQVPAVQENIVDANVEYKQYGPAAKQLLTTGTPGSDVAPFGVWSGECAGPFAITFRLKNSYVDMTGIANVRWFVKTSGFHVVRPVIKLPDGTMLVGDLTFESIPMLTQSEFSLAGIRWLKLDPARVVTLGAANAVANETWVPTPDLNKIDEIGFADLMPSSGHGTGGYIQLGNIEVYGKAIPRDATTSSKAAQ
jgi:hypothetical protein